ncbi:MAG: thioredoxin [Leptolyngbya sp.]|nr:thioredoxin [Candidatus Melainabacteria bacterium]
MSGNCPTSHGGGKSCSKTVASAPVEGISQVTEQSFKSDVLEAKEPVLVDFYATWCGPCRQMSPIVDRLAKSYSGKVKIYKVDIDNSPELAKRYSIASIPAIKIFKSGEIVDASLGVTSEESLKGMLDKAL